MSFVWVQQWFALPVVIEGQMGDLPPDLRSHTMDFNAAGLREDQHAPLPSSPYKAQDNNTPFYSQLSSIQQGQPRTEHRSPAQQNPYYPSQQHDASAFKMGAMAGALPDYGSDTHQQASQSIPRSLSGASTSALVYQLGQNLQMPAHASGNIPVHASYGTGYATSPYQQGYMPQQSAQDAVYPMYNPTHSRVQGVAPMQNPYQSYPQPSQYMYYPAPYAAQGQYPSGFAAQGIQNQAMYGRRASQVTAPNGIPSQGVELSPLEGSFAGAPVGTAAAFGAPFYQGIGTYAHVISCSITHRCRSSSIFFCEFNSPRATSKTEAVRTRALGRKSATRYDGGVLERPLLPRGNQGHRKLVLNLQEQLRFRQLPN